MNSEAVNVVSSGRFVSRIRCWLLLRIIAVRNGHVDIRLPDMVVV